LKKILFISSFPPSDYGARPKVFMNYMKTLALNHNCEISLIIIGANNYKKHHFIKNYYFIKKPSFITQLLNILYNALILRNLPIQSCLYWSKINKIKIDDLINQLNPDVVFCEMIRTALYGKNLKSKTVLDMADLLSRRYYQQMNEKDKITHVAGQYEKSLNKFVNKVINYPAIQNKILEQEYKLLKRFEYSMPSLFNAVTLVSLKEVQMLKDASLKENIYWLPNGVDISIIPKTRKLLVNNKTITFIGILDNPHNEHGVLHFLDNIYPHILNKMPNVKIQILGRNPTAIILDKTDKMNNILVPGYVEDLDEYIQKSNLTIIPLKVGSGVKTKIFESLKYGIPVVSTSLGAEGIIPILKKFIFIKDNVSDFAETCVRILNNDVEIKEIQNSTPQIINSYYSWNNIGARLYNIIN